MEMMKAFKTVRKNGKKYKEERINTIKCNNFENSFTKPPSPVCPDNYKT